VLQGLLPCSGFSGRLQTFRIISHTEKKINIDVSLPLAVPAIRHWEPGCPRPPSQRSQHRACDRRSADSATSHTQPDISDIFLDVPYSCREIHPHHLLFQLPDDIDPTRRILSCEKDSNRGWHSVTTDVGNIWFGCDQERLRSP
jgi:hypothetical protein